MTVEQPDNDGDGLDERILAWRSRGRSFTRIAEAVGFGKASQANGAFNRALRRRPPDEQAAIRTQENGRLDRLAASVRANEALSEAEATRRLAVVERLRTRLMAE